MANLANLLLKGISNFDFLRVLYGLPVLFALSLWQVGASCTRGHKLRSKLLFWFSLIGWHQVSGTEVKDYVNGKEYTGDPSNIILDAHEEFVLQIGPSWITPPSSYKFSPNF